MKKLFVGKLSYSCTDAGLRAIFENYGNILSAKVIMDKMTGQSRGFGFVELQEDDKAMQAIQDLNGKSVDGRQIVVSEANSDQRGGAGGGGRSFGGDSRGGGGGGRGPRNNNRGGGGGSSRGYSGGRY